MTGWKRKRFWKSAAVAEADGGGWQVLLDQRVLKTPAKAALVLPSRALAEAVAAEWDAQEGEVDPRTMPCTRSSNSAIDKVAPQRDEVIAILAEYGRTDLLCYRAEAPAELVRRQAEAWDPLLRWAADELGAPLSATAGVIAVDQPEGSLSRLSGQVAALSDFELAGFHDLVALSGSLVIALAVIHRLAPAEALWQASRVDESWQEELWGKDAEAAELAETKRRDFLHAARFVDLSRGM